MSDLAIRVAGLGKRYRIGGPRARYRTIRESVIEAAKAPFRRLSSALRGEKTRPDGDTIWALKDVAFEVRRGEVVGVIGQNGAGKSTLLKVLSRITEPTEGWAEIHGRVGSLLEVGTGFHPELTGRENIYLSGAVLGMRRKEIDQRFDEIVEFSGVEQFLDTPLKHYSSGMQVRLGFAVAAHLEPEILLVDEVLAVGDAEFQRKCLGKMSEVAQGGRTVLFVSHNMEAVLRLCPDAVLLRAGRVAESGCAADVVEAYLTGGIEVDGSIATLFSERSAHADDFRFSSASVCRPGGSQTDQISLNEGLDVELEYWMGAYIRGVIVACHLWNSRGTCVLTTTDVDRHPESAVRIRKPGHYTACCHIPRQYLRPGRYYLGLSASIPSIRTLANLPRILGFDVIDTGSVESRLGQGREGVISPVLDWSTIQVADDG